MDELAVSCRVTKKGVAEAEAGRHVATAMTTRGEKIILRYCYAMRIKAAEQVFSSSTSPFIGCVLPCGKRWVNGIRTASIERRLNPEAHSPTSGLVDRQKGGGDAGAGNEARGKARWSRTKSARNKSSPDEWAATRFAKGPGRPFRRHASFPRLLRVDLWPSTATASYQTVPR